MLIVDHYFLLLDYDSSSPSSSFSVVTSTNTLSSSTSPLVIRNSSSFSSLSSSSSMFTSETLQFLLQNDKGRWDVVSNTAKAAMAVHWLNFTFPAKVKGSFASCRYCKKIYVYNSYRGTSHLRRHFCTINHHQRSATSPLKQSTAEQSLIVHKNLTTTTQATTIKDLIASQTCTATTAFL